MSNRLFSITMVLLLALGVTVAGKAQEATPVTDSLSLPDPFVFGPTWVEADRQQLEPLPGTQAERWLIWYTDDRGSRIAFEVFSYGSSVGDALAAYQYADERLSDWYYSLRDAQGRLSSSELQRLDPLMGCVQSIRTEGYEIYTDFPVGATGCLDEKGRRVIVVVVSGLITHPQTDERLRYHEASDYVIEQMLAVH